MEGFGRISGLVWNATEQRPRSPVRIVATVVLTLLALQFAVLLVSRLGDAVGLSSVLQDVLVFALALVSLLGITRLVDRRRLADVGLGVDRAWWLDLIAGLVVGLGMVATVVAALWAAGFATIRSGSTPADPAIAFGGGVGGLAVAFLFFFAAAFVEEFLLRGYLLVNVAEGLCGLVGSERRAILGAVLITSLLFGALHAANPGGTGLAVLNIAVAGVLFGLAYATTGRLAFPIGAHVTWNIGLVAAGLPVSGLTTDIGIVTVDVSGPQVVTGGAFGPEAGLVTLLSVGIGAVAFALWTIRREGELSLDSRVTVPDLLSAD